MSNIYLFRHGSTEDNAKNVSRGWTNHPLSPEGKKEVEKGAEKLKGLGIKAIVTSDLKRAVQSAEIISKMIKAPIVAKIKNLRTWNVGIYTEKPRGEFPEEYYDNPKKKIPEGESLETFTNRVLGEIREIKKFFKNEKIAIVAHNRVERIFDAWKEKGMPDNLDYDLDCFRKRGVDPGGVKLE